MNSLREIIEASPSIRHLAFESGRGRDDSQALASPRWDWSEVRRVLVVRLRSIGDTVLSTPSLFALRRFLPQAEIDILLEEWVAPLLDGSHLVDRVIAIESGGTARARAARAIRTAHYDVVYNLHGGTTATLLTRASDARHRVGFQHYQYTRFHNHVAPSPLQIWRRPRLHSVEQQLALIGWTGVPVTDRPPTQLAVTGKARLSVSEKLNAARLSQGLARTGRLALIHPAAAFETKQWATEKFARVAEDLAARELIPVAIAAPNEKQIVDSLITEASARVLGLTNLSLPEVTALAARSSLFVGNDNGIGHIAAAVGAPCVIVFGSSNVVHWRPWTTRPNEVVREELPCQPCHGYFCAEFEKPECILRVPVERVTGAIDRVLKECAQQSRG